MKVPQPTLAKNKVSEKWETMVDFTQDGQTDGLEIQEALDKLQEINHGQYHQAT